MSKQIYIVISNKSVTNWSEYHISIEILSRGDGRYEHARGLPGDIRGELLNLNSDIRHV